MKKTSTTAFDMNLLLPILNDMGVSFEEITKKIIEKYGKYGDEYYIEKIKSSIKYDKENKGNTLEILFEEIYSEMNDSSKSKSVERYIEEKIAIENDPYKDMKQELLELKMLLLTENIEDKRQSIKTKINYLREELSRSDIPILEGIEALLDDVEDFDNSVGLVFDKVEDIVSANLEVNSEVNNKINKVIKTNPSKIIV